MQCIKNWLSFIVTIFFLFAACKDKPLQPDNVTVALEITAQTRAVFSGSSLQLTATATLNNGKTTEVTPNVTWSIQPGKAGRISSSGLFSATNNTTGTETVRADYKGQSATFQIDVGKRAITLAIWPVTGKVAAGGTLSFEAIAEYQDVSREYVTPKVTWTITPGTAATIDNAGILRAKPGVTGFETVTGTFQSLSSRSQIEVQTQFSSRIELVTIPAGSFIMGDINGRPNERPAHSVELSAFAIGKYEVTNEQYAQYLTEAFAAGEIFYESTLVTGKIGPFAAQLYTRTSGAPEFPDTFIDAVPMGNGYEFFARAGFEKYPVVRMNWYGAAAFCAFYGYRLPTEAEWEKACRGGQFLDYGTSDGSISHDLANFEGTGGRDTFSGPAPVGSFPPNTYGIYDIGNAAEYVFDLYDANYYSISPSLNPIGPGPAMILAPLPGGFALYRGGPWAYRAFWCRSAFRNVVADQIDFNYLDGSFVGFRVARSL